MKSRGLGDTIEKFTKATGIKKLADSIPGGCGCDHRKDWFNKNFQAKITYTADPYSFKNIGAGISTQIGPVNLYLLADNLLYLSNLYAAKSANVQLGINFIFYDNN